MSGFFFVFFILLSATLHIYVCLYSLSAEKSFKLWKAREKINCSKFFMSFFLFRYFPLTKWQIIKWTPTIFLVTCHAFNLPGILLQTLKPDHSKRVSCKQNQLVFWQEKLLCCCKKKCIPLNYCIISNFFSTQKAFHSFPINFPSVHLILIVTHCQLPPNPPFIFPFSKSSNKTSSIFLAIPIV